MWSAPAGERLFWPLRKRVCECARARHGGTVEFEESLSPKVSLLSSKLISTSVSLCFLSSCSSFPQGWHISTTQGSRVKLFIFVWTGQKTQKKGAGGHKRQGNDEQRINSLMLPAKLVLKCTMPVINWIFQAWTFTSQTTTKKISSQLKSKEHIKGTIY